MKNKEYRTNNFCTAIFEISTIFKVYFYPFNIPKGKRQRKMRKNQKRKQEPFCITERKLNNLIFKHISKP